MIDPEFNFDKNFRKKQIRYEGWRVENSIFRDFKADNQIFLQECFEYDFINTKIKKYVKPEELETVKSMLYSIYEVIINVFKSQASCSINRQDLVIDYATILDMVKQSRLGANDFMF